MKLYTFILFTALFVAGCVSPPKRDLPDIRVEVPGSWTGTDAPYQPEGVDTAQWWIDFNEPALNDLVREALQYNYSIKGAAARVDAALAVARSAGADLVPGANANFSASRRKQNLIGIPIPGAGKVISTRSTSFGLSLDILWEVDLWGRIRSGKSAALADLQASWADLAAIRLSIAAQTVKAWFAVTESRLQVELAEQTVENYRLSADQVRKRYERGTRSSLDLRLALSTLYSAEALLEQRKELLDRTTRQMEILLGRYPAGGLTADKNLPTLKREVPPGLPSELLIRRPDLLAAERRFAAAEKRVSEARRAFFPRITLTASGGALSQELKDLADGDFSVWSIAAGLTQPIFQGGRLRANLALSEARADQALVDYTVALLTAFGEAESALFTEASLARRETSMVNAVEQSEAARRLAERQYNEGLVDYIVVLETQRQALTSQSELLSVRRQRLDARANLYLALGGGFRLTEQWNQFLHTQNNLETEDSVE